MRPRYILPLRRLIAAHEKKDNRLPFKAVVDAVARPVIDLQLIDAFPHGTVSAEVAEPHTVEPDTDLLPGGYVPEAVEPLLERLSPIRRQVVLNGVREGLHPDTVAYKLHLCKRIIVWQMGATQKSEGILRTNGAKVSKKQEKFFLLLDRSRLCATSVTRSPPPAFDHYQEISNHNFSLESFFFAGNRS